MSALIVSRFAQTRVLFPKGIKFIRCFGNKPELDCVFSYT